LEHCAGLPLALTLVAVQAAAEPDVPLEDLARDLSNERYRLDMLDDCGKTGLRAVFSWSYNALSAGTARVFRMLGIPHSPDISLSAAAALAGTDQRYARRKLAELCKAHLLARRPGDRYVFHDLIRAYARERLYDDDTAGERDAALQRLLDHYLYTIYAVNRKLLPTRELPKLDYVDSQLRQDCDTYEEALSWWDAEHVSVLAMIRQAAKQGLPRAPWLAHAAAFPFKLRGQIHELKASSTEGFEAARVNGNLLAQAHLLVGLAVAHYFHREFDLAIQCQQSACDLFSRLNEDRRRAAVLADMGEVYLSLGRHADAADSARQALGIEEKLMNAEAVDPGASDVVLGSALAHLGDFRSAFAHLHRSLEKVGSDRFGMGYRLAFLGEAYILLGDITNAIQAYQRAVEIHRGIGHRRGEGVNLKELGTALYFRGDTRAARESWEASLTILERLGNPEARTVRSLIKSLDS
jgi:tetratricopeptide (TPR) repeat protein